jgi:hypothetical protein
MKDTLAVTIPKDSQVELRRPQPSVADMLQTVIDKGITGESVGVMEKLVGLYERMEEKNAEKAFAAAFVSLQAEMPKVQATKAVPNNDGTVRYKFAPFEDLMAQVGPMLQKHGFTVFFSSEVKEGRIITTCTLQHIGGHKRANSFTVRIGAGPPKATESQADGAAATYGKRFALTDALNIVVAHMDSDARLEGGAITPEQAIELDRRVQETNSDTVKFLKFAGAASFAEIPAAKYPILDEFLKRKERSGK